METYFKIGRLIDDGTANVPLYRIAILQRVGVDNHHRLWAEFFNSTSTRTVMPVLTREMFSDEL